VKLQNLAIVEGALKESFSVSGGGEGALRNESEEKVAELHLDGKKSSVERDTT
jgi:hypothetical protein